MDRAALLAYARDALAKLYQESLLEIHPLAVLLLPEIPIAARGTALKQRLLDLMQQLRPPHSVSYDSPNWRRYRSLFQFYVEGRSFEEIAHQHGISERQARRDHHQAITELGEYLWAQYCEVSQKAGSTRWTGPSEEPALSTDLASSLESELSRIGSLPVDQPVHIGETLRGVVAMVERLAKRLGTRIELTIVETPLTVAANPNALRQALLSVVSWAIEADPGGSVVITADIASGCAEVRIRTQRRLENVAAAAHDSERLMVCQRLLELQGGRLETLVNAAPNVDVRLILPATTASTVLVVDDNPDIVRLFQRYLHASPYHLIQATNGEQALQLAREVRPSVITLDLMMPARDGWDLLQVLTVDEATRHVPIVVVSIVHERALAMALGATAFVPKPVNRSTLIEALTQCHVGSLNRVESRA